MLDRTNSSNSLLDLFQPGDLLFGLEDKARLIFYDDLKSKLENLQVEFNFITIDDIVKPLEPFYIYDNTTSSSPLKNQASPVRKHGMLLLSSSEFNAVSQSPASPTTQEHNKILISCLLSIKHHFGKIHFCLDGLNLNSVRSKIIDHKKFEGYTSHELRYIASHYQEVEDKVLFYLKGQLVKSPWGELGQSPHEWLENYLQNEVDNQHRFPPHTTARVKLRFLDEAQATNLEREIDLPRAEKRAKIACPHS